LSIGDAEFEGNIANAQVFDAKRHLDNPGARRLEIEDALVVTLKKHGIVLPPSFFTVMSNFKPKYPSPHVVPPAASTPKPNDDDPIGSGGFITPAPK
jgi:hypothetical protein